VKKSGEEKSISLEERRDGVYRGKEGRKGR
jgi:hypothetical protein